jgi:hypothetical protein
VYEVGRNVEYKRIATEKLQQLLKLAEEPLPADMLVLSSAVAVYDWCDFSWSPVSSVTFGGLLAVAFGRHSDCTTGGKPKPWPLNMVHCRPVAQHLGFCQSKAAVSSGFVVMMCHVSHSRRGGISRKQRKGESVQQGQQLARWQQAVKGGSSTT